MAWAFQTTHHDVWDYDVPAQPTLGMVTYKGVTAPAVLQTTKQGLLFTLNRDTGQPIIPVVERPVPQGGAIGETLSPTQPFPIAPRQLAPNRVRAADAFGLTPWDRKACEKLIAGARNDGMYTPPSTQGTILYPFTGGGSNWGGISYDPGPGRGVRQHLLGDPQGHPDPARPVQGREAPPIRTPRSAPIPAPATP